MKKNDQIFYCNKPARFVADLGDEVVIEVLAGEVRISNGDYYEPPCDEPIYHKIIVAKRYVTASQIDLERSFLEAQLKVKDLRETARREIAEEKRDAERDLVALRKKIGKFEGLEQFYKFLNGDYKFVVRKGSYRGHTIVPIEKLTADDGSGYDRHKALAAVSFRKDGDKVKMYTERYSDGSGSSRDEITGYETLDQAKEGFIAAITAPKYEISYSDVETADQYGLSTYGIVQYKEEAQKRKAAKSAKQAAKLKAELAALEKGEDPCSAY